MCIDATTHLVSALANFSQLCSDSGWRKRVRMSWTWAASWAGEVH